MSGLLSTSTASLWERQRKTVASSSTATLYSKQISAFRGVEFDLAIFNTTENKYRTQKIFVSRQGSANIKHTVLAKLGDNINIDLNISVSGSEVKLDATNNETFDLSVSIYRLELF